MKALTGYACRFNKITQLHHGVRKMVLPGAFDLALASGASIKFMLGSHHGECIGSTADNLELHSDNYGLAFRLRLPNTDLGNSARAVAATKLQTAMSIGFNYDSALKQNRIIDGLDVVVIAQAWLHEVTWLHNSQGAVQDAFASYQAIDNNSSLREDCESLKLLCEGAAVGVSRALRALRFEHSSGLASR